MRHAWWWELPATASGGRFERETLGVVGSKLNPCQPPSVQSLPLCPQEPQCVRVAARPVREASCPNPARVSLAIGKLYSHQVMLCWILGQHPWNHRSFELVMPTPTAAALATQSQVRPQATAQASARQPPYRLEMPRQAQMREAPLGWTS